MPPVEGERFDEGYGHVLEWTGEVWAPVCPTDDTPMDDRDRQGWLRCGTCGVRSVDAAKERMTR